MGSTAGSLQAGFLEQFDGAFDVIHVRKCHIGRHRFEFLKARKLFMRLDVLDERVFEDILGEIVLGLFAQQEGDEFSGRLFVLCVLENARPGDEQQVADVAVGEEDLLDRVVLSFAFLEPKQVVVIGQPEVDLTVGATLKTLVVTDLVDSTGLLGR
ncbi:MAG: hypothetical protein R3236_02435, partial [Phycisphaeraceae bacterium]|nr:hypothetical protein [Phycisphaeraceae bacterium]